MRHQSYILYVRTRWKFPRLELLLGSSVLSLPEQTETQTKVTESGVRLRPAGFPATSGPALRSRPDFDEIYPKL